MPATDIEQSTTAALSAVPWPHMRYDKQIVRTRSIRVPVQQCARLERAWHCRTDIGRRFFAEAEVRLLDIVMPKLRSDQWLFNVNAVDVYTICSLDDTFGRLLLPPTNGSKASEKRRCLIVITIHWTEAHAKASEKMQWIYHHRPPQSHHYIESS